MILLNLKFFLSSFAFGHLHMHLVITHRFCEAAPGRCRAARSVVEQSGPSQSVAGGVHPKASQSLSKATQIIAEHHTEPEASPRGSRLHHTFGHDLVMPCRWSCTDQPVLRRVECPLAIAALITIGIGHSCVSVQRSFTRLS